MTMFGNVTNDADGTVSTFNGLYKPYTFNYQQISSKELQIDITPEMCMWQGTYYDECITTVGNQHGTYQSCRCDNMTYINDNYYDNLLLTYCVNSDTWEYEPSNQYPCYFQDFHKNLVNLNTTLKTVTIEFNWEQMMTSLRINGGDTQIGEKGDASLYYYAYSSSSYNGASNLVTFNEKYPAMPVLYGNLTQKMGDKKYTYDTYYTMTTAIYRPMVIETFNWSTSTDSSLENTIMLSLDYFPLNNPQYQNYYCPFNTTQTSECSPFSEINYGSLFNNHMIANMTGAGLQLLLATANGGLNFQGGFLYRGPIPTFDLQDYNPVTDYARLYFCRYGTYNLLAKTMSTTYATINPILSVVLAIIIMVALFQIRYIYGHDIQQLYYQEIENNKQYQQNRTSNNDPYDVIASQRKEVR